MNVETRLVMGTGFLVHTLEYGQMRCHFRSDIPGANSGYGCAAKGGTVQKIARAAAGDSVAGIVKGAPIWQL